MPPASVNTISRASQAAAVAPASQIDANPNSFNLRDFVVDEDAANFTTALWKSIDQTAFVHAQREALEAFNVAKALRLSEETAALEHQRRTSAAASSSASTSASANARASTSASVLENKPGPSSSASDFARQKSTSASSSLHERKPSSSASTAAQQSSPPRLSLSTQSSYSSDNTTSGSSSRTANSVSASSSASQSHASQSHRIDQRSLSKRELDSPVTKLSISMSPYSSASTSASSSASASASASASSSSRNQISDVTNTKRRRTERQPSTSPNTPSATQQYYQQQQQQQQQIVAPVIAVPKKSTGPTRDVRPEQNVNLKENHPSTPLTPVEPRSRRRSTVNSTQPPKTAPPAPEPRDTFTATRSCTKCGTPVLSPRGQPSTEMLDIIPLLHVTCIKCQTTHCRGCFAPARCNRALVLASSSSRSAPTSAVPSAQCDGGSTCTVRTCCAAVRAIAIFEALSWFDEIYATEAGFGSHSKSASSDTDKGKSRETKEYRDAYVRMLISKTDVMTASKTENRKAERAGSTRRFEDAFVRTLRLICTWLQVPDRDDDDDTAAEDNGRDAMHASIPRLFMSSMLLEVVHVFLSNTNVRDWVAHAETYIAILDLLRRMLDLSSSSTSSTAALTSASWADSITLTTILRAPIRRIESSSGLRRAVWGDASVRYEDLNDAAAAGRLAEGSSRNSLCDLVKHLEVHRRPLMALAAKITFAATVEKVNNLCDGISYLLLQQVVGGI